MARHDQTGGDRQAAEEADLGRGIGWRNALCAFLQ